jgi:ABC-type molybdate transport system ATPase subunit
VPERFPATQPFTVGHYLTAMGAVRGLPAVAGAVDRWVERLGLGPYRTVKLPDLSKGTAQKVGLAQALLAPPGLLVLDEPWEGLDAATRDLVPEIVAEVTAAGGSVLVSDHRGEIARLPGATRWTVGDATVTAVPTADAGATWVVEIAVSSADAADTVARLRSAGHRVVGVRPAAPSRNDVSA